MKNKLIATVLAASIFCAGGAAQQPQLTPAEDAGMQVRVVEMKHLTGDKLDALANRMYNILNPGRAVYDPTLNVVVLKGRPQQVDAVEALLRKADVPEAARRSDAQAQLRLHLVAASPDAGADGPVSPEIAAAVEQMRKTFSYKSYREIDLVMAQAKNDGHVRMNGALPIGTGKSPSSYDIRVDNVSVNANEGSLGLRNLLIRLTIAYTDGGISGAYVTDLQTSLTLRKGQKAVVGKLSSDQRKDAIFVVLAADIL